MTALVTANFWCLLTLCLCFCTGAYGFSESRYRSSRLCPKSPSDSGILFRFHRETRRCYMVGDKGPCPDLMKFTMEDSDFGLCDCDHSLRCGRPLIYWPSRQRCYFVNDQGPCREGKWVVFGSDLNPLCKKNNCLGQEDKQPSFGSRYWFSLNNTCYRTYTKGYCSDDELLFNMKLHYRPTCQKQPDCGKPMESVQRLACLPGQRLDVDGHCKRKFLELVKTNKTDLNIQYQPKPSNVHCLFCDSRTTSSHKTKPHLNRT